MLGETSGREGGSFRDPSGHLFEEEGVLYRRVEKVYAEHYKALLDSGLYHELVTARLLIPHQDEESPPAGHENAFTIIRPERIPFISYPYEWSFEQLKDAALTTLEVQQKALAKGMVLKDASAFNIQFHKGRPTFIDTLSFERFEDGRPWTGYGQFCRHFLAPLALMAMGNIDANLMLRVHLDGIPLELASSLLPMRSRFKFSLFTHLHMHAKSVTNHAGSGSKSEAKGSAKFNMDYYGWLTESLVKSIQGLDLAKLSTEWADYYDNTSYSERAAEEKANQVEAYLDTVKPTTLIDLGANTGRYSRLAAKRGVYVVACDIDPVCVDKNYLAVRDQGEQNMLPLVMNLANPSPPLGWAHQERMSFAQRSGVDLVLALALVHHLAISNNLPLSMIAEFLAKLGKGLVIEFVPKQDPMVVKLFSSREDIFPDYTQAGFEAAFLEYFSIEERASLVESERILYLMHRR